MGCDNYHFNLICTPLEESLVIAFQSALGNKATHWKIVDSEALGGIPGGKLLLAWSEKAGKDFIPFLAPIGPQEAVDVVKGFLKPLKYGPRPDHDGDSGRSWRIYNDNWNHVGDNHYVFSAIEPEWAVYGK